MYDVLQCKGDKIFDKTYLEEEISFVPIPMIQQIVVQGSLCSSNWVDDKGNCLFDRSVDMQPIQYMDVIDSENSAREGKEGVYCDIDVFM